MSIEEFERPNVPYDPRVAASNFMRAATEKLTEIDDLDVARAVVEALRRAQGPVLDAVDHPGHAAVSFVTSITMAAGQRVVELDPSRTPELPPHPKGFNPGDPQAN